jgi:hypothetical protein
MNLQIMPPTEASKFMMDLEFIAIISVVLIVSIIAFDRLRRKLANR